MLNIPQYLIDASYMYRGSGWYPFNMLAMETSKNRIHVVITVSNVFNPTAQYPFDTLVSQETIVPTFFEKIKKKFLEWFDNPVEQERPVDPEKPEFTVEYIALDVLLTLLAHSDHRAAEIASYADVSSQFWMCGPFEDDIKFASFYESNHHQLMDVALKSVNWVVVESEYLTKARNALNYGNFYKYLENIARSRYAHFCQSVCFDLSKAMSYLPKAIQEAAWATLNYNDIPDAQALMLHDYCKRVVENGPANQTLFTPGPPGLYHHLNNAQIRLLTPSNQ